MSRKLQYCAKVKCENTLGIICHNDYSGFFFILSSVVVISYFSHWETIKFFFLILDKKWIQTDIFILHSMTVLAVWSAVVS